MATKKIEAINQINEKLGAEGIRQVDYSIIEWKMHMLVRDILKKQSMVTGMCTYI